MESQCCPDTSTVSLIACEQLRKEIHKLRHMKDQEVAQTE